MKRPNCLTPLGLFIFIGSFSIFLTIEIQAMNEMVHQNHEGVSKVENYLSSEPTIKFTLIKMEDRGEKKWVQIKLQNLKEGTPVTLDQLKEQHTQKIHLLIIDEGLQDYSHIHPRQTNEAGVYEFEWTPKTKGNYRVWVDLVPATTNVQEYVTGDLIKGKNEETNINKSVALQSELDGYTFNLTFDEKEVEAGKGAMGIISIKDSKGLPVKDLEPIMGSFAHIVGFSEDFKTIIHVHPMGEEPQSPLQRGGPELTFHMEPETPGFMKLFAQVIVKGKEIYVPFGLIIKTTK